MYASPQYPHQQQQPAQPQGYHHNVMRPQHQPQMQTVGQNYNEDPPLQPPQYQYPLHGTSQQYPTASVAGPNQAQYVHPNTMPTAPSLAASQFGQQCPSAVASVPNQPNQIQYVHTTTNTVTSVAQVAPYDGTQQYSQDPSKMMSGPVITQGQYGQPHSSQVAPYDPSMQQVQGDPNGILHGRWEVGFCSWYQSCIPNACMACCCPYIAMAQIAARMGTCSYGAALMWYCLLGLTSFSLAIYDNHEVIAVYLDGLLSVNEAIYSALAYSSAGIGVRLALLLFEFIFLTTVLNMRRQIRARFHIPGSSCEDTAVSSCTCCAIAQMATHIKSYKPNSCSISGPNVLQGYNTE